jgi:Resolvase, N terminal domain
MRDEAEHEWGTPIGKFMGGPPALGGAVRSGWLGVYVWATRHGLILVGGWGKKAAASPHCHACSMRKVKESIRTPRAARTRKPSKGQQVGYLRVSSLGQNEARQLEGLALDKRFTDKASGKDVKRPQLAAMQSFVREGDTVFCHSMDRLARNLDDLRRIVLGLTERGVHIVFVKENLTFTGEDSPMSNLLLSVMGAFAQFERELIRERQREGIAIARREGKYRAGSRL